MAQRSASPDLQREVVRRIAVGLKLRNMSQNELARKIGASSQGVADWFARDRMPGGELLISTIKVLNLSPEWVLMGTGDMFPVAGQSKDRVFVMGGVAFYQTVKDLLDRAIQQWTPAAAASSDDGAAAAAARVAETERVLAKAGRPKQRRRAG